MSMKPNREYRAFAGLQPEEEGNELILRGVPIVFDTPTCLYECDGIKYFEVIDRNALDGADMSDFIFNVNHGGRVYARTRNNSLTYQIDSSRMEITARLLREDEGHRQLYRDIRSGLIDKMSFAFTVAEDKYDAETRTRTILRVKKLYDVAAVDFPAYDDTSISARGFFQGEHQRELAELEELHRKMLIAQTYLI